MSGRLMTFGAAAALLLAFAAPVFADPPDVITLSETGVFGSLRRAPVRFTHKDHMALEGVDCLACHHQGDPSVTCAACHVERQALQNVFHQLCITCHEAEKRKGRMTGPRTCGECHAWQK